MKKNLIVMLLIVGLFVPLFSACTGPDGTTTLGNGKVDPVEAASLRVAVGLAFTARPDAIAPAYAVSTAILAVLPDGASAVPVSEIDNVIADQTAKLKLDPVTLQSFNDLVALAKAQITEQLGSQTPTSQAVVVVRDVVTIIQQTAAARLGLVQPIPATTPAPAPAPATTGTTTGK